MDDLTLTRTPKAESFHCGRCNAPKKAKLSAEWRRSDGSTMTICNGCYGNLLAGGDRLRVSLFNGKSKWVAHYRVDPDHTVSEEFS